MAVNVKALFFDVLGTLVDWRTSIAREAEAMLKPQGYALDWFAFADAWRGEYQGAMDEVRSGRIPFCKLDILHRRNLELILPRFGIATLSEEQRRDLNLAWHRLDAWPDVARASSGFDVTTGTPRLWIKICGLTDEAAVNAALQAGVDAIGFVFSPSPRQVQPAQAGRLAASARGKALCIAVTCHPKQELLDEIVREFKPDGWQTDINDLSVLRVPRQRPILPVLRSGSPALEAPPRRFLFEGPISGQGVSPDWREAAALASHAQNDEGRGHVA